MKDELTTLEDTERKLEIRLLPRWPMVNILTGPVNFRVNLVTFSGYPEPWSSKIPGNDRERTY